MAEADTAGSTGEVGFDDAPGGPEEARRLGKQGLSILAVGFVVSLLGSGLAVAGWASSQGLEVDDTTLGLQVAGLLGLWIGLLGVPLVAETVMNRGGSVRDLGLRFRWVDVPIGVAAGLASTVAVALAYSPFLRRSDDLYDTFSEPARRIAGTAEDTGGKVVLALFLVVLVPVVEECYFRGLAFRSLDRLLPTSLAVLIGGLVFGLAHFQLLQLPALVFFGVVLCALAHQTGRLGPGILAHAAFNSVTVVTLFR